MKTFKTLTRLVIAHGFWDIWEATAWFLVLIMIAKFAAGFSFRWVIINTFLFLLCCLIAQYRHEYKKYKNQR